MVSWNSLTRLGGSSCYITTYSSVFLYYEKLNIRWFNCFSYLVFQGQILPSIDLEESYGNIEKHGPSLPLWVKGAAKLLSSGEENQDWLALAKLMGEYWVKSLPIKGQTVEFKVIIVLIVNARSKNDMQ